MVESPPTGHRTRNCQSGTRIRHLSFGWKHTSSGLLDPFGESCSSVCCNGDWREAVVSYRRELKSTTKMFLPRSRGRFEGSWVHDVIGSLKLTQDCWCSPSGFSPMGRVNADLGEKSPPHRRAEVYK